MLEERVKINNNNNNGDSEDNNNKDIIILNDRQYILKKKMTVKQVRIAQQLTKDLIGIQQKISNATEEELEQLASEILNVTEPQQKFMVEIMDYCLGVSQDQLDEMEFIDAAILFDKIFKKSTTIPKNLSRP